MGSFRGLGAGPKVGMDFEFWIVRFGFGSEVVGYNYEGKERTSKFIYFI